MARDKYPGIENPDWSNDLYKHFLRRDILFYVLFSSVFNYVHFLHFGQLKMRFLLNQSYHKRLVVVKDFGFICVGIRKI